MKNFNIQMMRVMNIQPERNHYDDTDLVAIAPVDRLQMIHSVALLITGPECAGPINSTYHKCSVHQAPGKHNLGCYTVHLTAVDWHIESIAPGQVAAVKRTAEPSQRPFLLTCRVPGAQVLRWSLLYSPKKC